MIKEQIIQAQINEGRPPLSTNLGWVVQPQTMMGLNPHGPSTVDIPWWTYLTFANWDTIRPWAVIFPDSIQAHPVNSRVKIGNIGLAYWNKLSGAWVTVCNTSSDFLGQLHGIPDFTNTYSGYLPIAESDGRFSFKPAPGRCTEIWTPRCTFDYTNIGGVCCWISHVMIAENLLGNNDKWLIQIGGDYVPSSVTAVSPELPYFPGIGTGRIQVCTNTWRTATMFLTDGSFDMVANPPPVVRI